ncbi:hypothetical protein [uncultured Winogradskyella sp.]|uniref:hypothetical protein n=1 Tax=uncultured Winogradskyella sp. TaxID=395353 RepID=UPI002612460D|nr:hypothetical protein [uncultured Winogradskyella sp.]
MKERTSKNLNTVKKSSNKKGFIVGSILATIIAISPYLFYLHESVPTSQVWDTFLFTYNSRSWGDANLAMWILTGKALPLLFLIIWFFTCRHWWYHAILVPITMYTFQIFSFFNSELQYLDQFQLIYLVPIMAIIIPSIYLIRAQMFNKINYADKTMEELEAEFMIKPTTIWGKIKQYF